MTPSGQSDIEVSRPRQSTLASRMGEAAAMAALEVARAAGDRQVRVIVLTQVRYPPPGEDGAAGILGGATVPTPEALLKIARSHLDHLESCQ